MSQQPSATTRSQSGAQQSRNAGGQPQQAPATPHQHQTPVKPAPYAGLQMPANGVNSPMMPQYAVQFGEVEPTFGSPMPSTPMPINKQGPINGVTPSPPNTMPPQMRGNAAQPIMTSPAFGGRANANASAYVPTFIASPYAPTMVPVMYSPYDPTAAYMIPPPTQYMPVMPRGVPVPPQQQQPQQQHKVPISMSSSPPVAAVSMVPPPQPSAPARVKNIIPIIDPNTNAPVNVNEDVSGTKSATSGSGSSAAAAGAKGSSSSSSAKPAATASPDVKPKETADASDAKKNEDNEEAKQKADEEKAKREAEEAEAKRKAEEAEAKRKADEEAEAKRKADEEAEAKRKAQEEAEAKRKAEEEAEAKRKAEEETEAKRKAEEAAAAAAAAEAEKKRKQAEEAAEKERREKDASTAAADGKDQTPATETSAETTSTIGATPSSDTEPSAPRENGNPDTQSATPSPITIYQLLKSLKGYTVPPPGFNPPTDIMSQSFKIMRLTAPGGTKIVQDVRQLPPGYLTGQPPRASPNRPPGPGMTRTPSQSDTRGGSRPGQSGQQGGGARMSRTPSRGGDRSGNQQAMAQLTIPLDQIKPLEVTENRWVPLSKSQKELDDEVAREQLIFRKTRGLLNKLTIDNFDKLAEEIKTYQINTSNILKGVIAVIFEKALDEPKYAPMYAKLALVIQDHQKPIEEEMVDENGNVVKTQQTFRRLLLNKCQDQFENKDAMIEEQLSAEEKAKKTQEELEEIEYRRLKAKRHITGNITFIGELYKLNMITEKIMHDCIRRLLENAISPEESDIECLCNLLKTIGKKIDHKDAQTVMDAYFNRIQRMTALQTINSRMKFMMMDIIDLRNDKWIPRRAEAKIQKIEDVRNEAEQERLRAASASSSRGDGRSSDRRSSGKTPSMPILRDQRVGGREDFTKLVTSSKDGFETVNRSFAPAIKFQRNMPMQKTPSGGAPAPTTINNRFMGLVIDDSSASPSKSQPEQDTFAEADVDTEQDAEAAPSSTPRDKEPESPSPQPQPKSKVKMSHAQLEKQYTALFDEFMSSYEAKNVLETIQEYNAPDYNQKLVKDILLKKAESRKDRDVAQVARLLGYLVKNNGLSRSDFLEGFNKYIEELDDASIDIPALPNFVGEYIRAAVCQGGLSLSILEEDLTSLKEQRATVDKVMATLLTGLVGPVSDATQRAANEVAVRSQLQAINFDLFAFLSQAFVIKNDRTKFSNWLQSKGLAFLDANDALAKFQSELASKLVQKASADDLIKWLETAEIKKYQDSNAFVAILTNQLLAHATTKSLASDVNQNEDLPSDLRAQEQQILAAYEPLLKRYLTLKEEHGLQAICAIQAFCSLRAFPQDLAGRLFSWFLSKNISSSTLFSRWREEAQTQASSVDSKQWDARREMLRHTESFFASLKKDNV